MLRAFRYELRSYIAAHPYLYLPIARRKYGSADSDPKTNPNAGLAVCSETSLVLEAFPRSGNTFACKAFLSAQARRVTLAHHLHSPAQIMAGSTMGVPALLIVRQPIDAVCSLLQRERGITPRQALSAWLRFYGNLTDYRETFVTATFDQVTSDFGGVIDRVNRRFQTSFDRFEHTPDHEEAVLHDIDAKSTEDISDQRTHEQNVARPSKSRDMEKAFLIKQLYQPRLSNLRLDAEHLYARFHKWAAE